MSKNLLIQADRASSTESLDSRFTYEHFPVVCPTCRGCGRLSADGADKLVAPIPVGDRRLKPTRTKLKIAIALVLILITGALCLAFLLPRSVDLEFVSAVPMNSSFSDKDSPWIIYKVTINAVNNNFFPVHLSDIDASITFEGYEAGKSNSILMRLPMRDTKQLYSIVNSTYNSLHTAKNILWECHKLRLEVVQLLQTTASLSYMFHLETLSISEYFYTDCSVLVPESQQTTGNIK